MISTKTFIIQQKTNIKLAFIFLALILLGASLALFSDSHLLIIPFMGILALTTFASLDYALYILAAFLPFSFRFIMASGTEMQVPTEPLLAIMAVSLVFRWIIMKQKGIQMRFPLRVPMLIFALGICLSLINANDLYMSLKGAFRALMYMMLSVVVFSVINDRQRLKRFFIVSIIPATITVGWTVIFLIDRIEIWRWSTAYEGLPFTSYSHYGAFVAVILSILMARSIFDKGSYDRVIWTILLVFYAIALCFSFSRGVWLSYIAAIGLMLLQRSGGTRHKKVLIIGGAVAFILILLVIPYIAHPLISRFMTIFSFSYASNRARLLRWGAAIMMFTRHPIIGSGYNSFALSYVDNPELIGSLIKFQMGAHSEYLQILAETGLIGFSGWIGTIVLFYLYGFRLLKKLGEWENNGQQTPISKPQTSFSFWRSIVIGVMAAQTSMLVHLLVNNLVQAYIFGVPFWILMGILPAIGNIVEKENQYDESKKSI
jgi:O-antigen ligase